MILIPKRIGNIPHKWFEISLNRNEKLKRNLLQIIPFLIAALITGAIAVIYTRLFSMAEGYTSLIFHYKAWLLFIITPICFITSWWLVKYFSPYARGSGIPQVMAAIELTTPKDNYKINKLLSIRVIIVKIISSIILVFGGGAIGREGPTIQIAGSVFRKINELLPSWWPKISKRNMIMTGAAAGLAAAFNTPLGGIMFTIEELTKSHLSSFRTPIFIAVIVAGLTAQGLAGPYLYLGYPVIENLSNFIIFGVALVAILAGLMGSYMSKILLIIFTWKSKFKFNYQHILYLLLCSFFIAFIACFINEGILGSGKQLMVTTLFSSHKYSQWYMPLLRIVGPICSFTTNASAGIFAPGLSAGASIGSVISCWFNLSPSDTNLMILAGMVAFLTSITRTPFTSAILVIEMTDRHNLIFYLMLAGILASFASMIVDKHSLYDHLRYQYLEDLQKE